MSKRRGNGEGSICKRKDGLWQCQVTTGFDDNGKPKRKEKKDLLWQNKKGSQRQAE